MDRRDMLKTVAAIGALPLFAGYNKIEAAIKGKKEEIRTSNFQEINDTTLLDARKKARRRFRRIIMNNDGNDCSFKLNKPVSPELFLSKRTSGLINSQVDSIFYCDGINYVYSHRSQLTEYPKPEEKKRTLDILNQQGTDPLSLIISFCRDHNKEIFWSMRMNDNHDATRADTLLSRFKEEHPELLVGKKGVKMPMMSNKWSAFDYGQKPVRDLAVNIIADVVNQYDVDGIELDFFRHPAFFRAQFYGEPVTQNDCDKMTDMVREIRDLLNQTSIRRQHPILLAIRVPDSIGFSKAIGLDWEQWLKEELIDIVTGGDYIKFEPWTNLAAIGRQYNVPVYACLEQRRLTNQGNDAERETAIELWRGEAYIAWNSGMNGIYTFNRFNPHDPIFKELGDPTLLAKLPMTRKESYFGAVGSGYFDPDYWVKGGRLFGKEK